MAGLEWCFWGNSPWCAGWIIEKLVFPLAIAYTVYRLALYQIEKTREANLTQLDRKRQIDFADKQLTEFYAPMMGARAEIYSDKVFDTHLYRAAQFVEEKYAELESDDEGREERRRIAHAGLGTSRYEGRVEAYVAMRRLFATKMAYADQDTRDWYEYFHAFVEMLRAEYGDEGVDGVRPPGKERKSEETLGALASMFEERPLEPFYRHLEERTEQIQREIRGLSVERVEAEPPPKVQEPWLFLQKPKKR